MENYCIFCRKMLGRFQKKSLWCGGASEIVCQDCYQKYAPYANEERARLALEEGRPVHRMELQQFAERMEAVKAERELQQALENQKRVTDKQCLRCGGRMLDYGLMMFKLGEEVFFMSDLKRIMDGSLQMQVLCCENCGKAEFYIPGEVRKRIDEER